MLLGAQLPGSLVVVSKPSQALSHQQNISALALQKTPEAAGKCKKSDIQFTQRIKRINRSSFRFSSLCVKM